ncbi:triose-phosphate isomerase, partial [Staphylococcus epidermidis]|uniref:triose-phosphate isomerase n=1 Tax=Staphylococcus epidermidis TaxID=1282 RepID=UPI0011A4D259
MTTPIIPPNSKINKTLQQPKHFLNQLPTLPHPKQLQSLISPPTIQLHPLLTALKHTKPKPLKIPPQNPYFQQTAPYTPQTSPLPLSQLPLKYLLIPHSHPPHYFHQTHQQLNKKP